MTKENFLGIKNPDWWSQETQAVFGLCYPWMRGLARIKEFYKKGYEVAVIPFANDYGWHFLDKKKSLELAEKVVAEHLKSHDYTRRIINHWQQDRKKLLKIFALIDKIDLSGLAAKQLWHLYEKLMLAYIAEFSLPLVLEAFEPYTSDVFLKQFNQEQKQKLMVLSQPKFRSFISKYQTSLLNLVLEIFNNQNLRKLIKQNRINENLVAEIKRRHHVFYQQLIKHQRNYFWINNTYKNIEYLTPVNFLMLLKEEMQNRRRENILNDLKKFSPNFKEIKQQSRLLIKELKLSKKNLAIVNLFDLFAPWHDERKRLMMMAGHYLNKVLSSIEKLKAVPLVKLQYYQLKELKGLLLENKQLADEITLERRKYSVWVGAGRKEYWFVGKQARQVRALFFRRQADKVSIINGVPASPGLVIGKVRVVLDAINDEFRQGEILVAAMTRPEFVPLMKKAAAIITDEGGLTSHAAIVSRELGVPCVVGTRVATKVLRNGDKVEVRAHRGEVKILKN